MKALLPNRCARLALALEPVLAAGQVSLAGQLLHPLDVFLKTHQSDLSPETLNIVAEYDASAKYINCALAPKRRMREDDNGYDQPK